jgi:hypothetical protein
MGGGYSTADLRVSPLRSFFWSQVVVFRPSAVSEAVESEAVGSLEELRAVLSVVVDDGSAWGALDWVAKVVRQGAGALDWVAKVVRDGAGGP